MGCFYLNKEEVEIGNLTHAKQKNVSQGTLSATGKHGTYLTLLGLYEVYTNITLPGNCIEQTEYGDNYQVIRARELGTENT